MRSNIIIPIISILVVFLSVAVFAQSYDYEAMKMDEYKAELAKWQQRLADANTALTQEESKCQQTQDEMASVQDTIDGVWGEIYGLLGTDEAGYKDYLSQLRALESELSGFVALSPEDIYARKNEIQGFKDRYQAFLKDKRSLGNEAQAILGRIKNLIDEAENKAQPAAAGRYEVVRGDYLWKIARKPEIYSDAFAWIRIYTSNRDQIKNPDLIYPAQIFRIPQVAGPNEHWVVRGEYLTKIAGYSQVYGNSFQWQRIYDANKDVISDPNVIYPHMVLQIPR
jgi:nucleoid-associated protein YgaU